MGSTRAKQLKCLSSQQLTDQTSSTPPCFDLGAWTSSVRRNRVNDEDGGDGDGSGGGGEYRLYSLILFIYLYNMCLTGWSCHANCMFCHPWFLHHLGLSSV